MNKRNSTIRTLSPLLAGLIAASAGFSVQAQTTFSSPNGVVIKKPNNGAPITVFSNDGSVTIPGLCPTCVFF